MTKQSDPRKQSINKNKSISQGKVYYQTFPNYYTNNLLNETVRGSIKNRKAEKKEGKQ